MRVYCAGPLFTPAYRAHMTMVAARLRSAGFDCFVPQEQEINRAGRQNAAAEVFAIDLTGVKGANALVAVLDGPDVSSGTAAEIGLFYSFMQHDPTKKGIVGLLSDERALGRIALGLHEEPINAFTLGCLERVGRICFSLDEVVAQLKVML